MPEESASLHSTLSDGLREPLADPRFEPQLRLVSLTRRPAISDFASWAEPRTLTSLDLTGMLQSETWGTFRTYFRFQLGPSGKIKRLDIGQAD